MTPTELPPTTPVVPASDLIHEPEHPARTAARQRIASYPPEFFENLEYAINKITTDARSAGLVIVVPSEPPPVREATSVLEPEHPARTAARQRIASYPPEFFENLEYAINKITTDARSADLVI